MADHGHEMKTPFELLDSNKEGLLHLSHEMLEANEGSVYPIDLFAIGAIKRSVSIASGFKLLVQSFNMVCARTLLRIQIDTVIRFFTIFLVENPHDFCMQILRGEQINRLKDAKGNKLTDAYLIKVLSEDYPWLPIVYKNLSGYVHLSDKHLFVPVKTTDKEIRSVQFEISDRDIKYPESSWCEVVGCFNEATYMFTQHLKQWIQVKSNTKTWAKT